MRLAIGMFDLGVAQDAVRDLDPKDLIQMRFDCMPFKKPIYLYHIGGGYLVDQIGLHSRSLSPG